MPTDIVVRRRPQARVAFLGLGGELLLTSPETLRSVETVKSIRTDSPVGSFQLSFAPSAGPGVLHGNAQQVTPQGAIDRWLDVLRPMAMVFIALGDEPTLAQVDRIFAQAVSQKTSLFSKDLLANIDTRRAVQSAMVMVGLVDSAVGTTLVTMDGPQRVVQVSGSDMGKLFVADNVQTVWAIDALGNYVDGTQPATPHSGLRPALVMAGNNSSRGGAGVTQADANSLAERYSPVAGQGFLSEFHTTDALLSLPDVITTLLHNMPSFRVRLANGQWLTEFLPRPTVQDDLANKFVFAYKNYMSFVGSLWQSIKQIAPPPFAECFVDSVGFGAQLIVRRPPFGRPAMMKGSASLLHRVLKTAQQADSTVVTDAPNLFRRDEFTHAELRVVDEPAGERYHTVGSSDVIELLAGRSDADMSTTYQVLHSDFSGDPSVLASAFPILVDAPGSRRFGSKPSQWLIPWWWTDGVISVPSIDAGPRAQQSGTPATQSGWWDPTPFTVHFGDFFKRPNPASLDPALLAPTQNVFSLELAAKECVRAYYYFRDNAEYLSGTATLRGRAEIRIGDRLYFKDRADDLIVYLEEVRQTWTFGQPYLTNVLFSRGQPKNATRRLATYDTDPPLGLE